MAVYRVCWPQFVTQYIHTTFERISMPDFRAVRALVIFKFNQDPQALHRSNYSIQRNKCDPARLYCIRANTVTTINNNNVSHVRRYRKNYRTSFTKKPINPTIISLWRVSSNQRYKYSTIYNIRTNTDHKHRVKTFKTSRTVLSKSQWTPALDTTSSIQFRFNNNFDLKRINRYGL